LVVYQNISKHIKISVRDSWRDENIKKNHARE